MPTQPSKRLETFDNPHPERDYTIEMVIPEFTCLCPKTGQPDFATLYLDYVPDRKCVELKSLKIYIWAFRNEGAFHEAVTNAILKDLVAATAPRYMRLRAEFYVRGGIYTTVTAEHRKPGWAPLPPVPRPPAPPEDAPTASGAARNTASGARDTGAGGERFRMLARNRSVATPGAPAAAAAADDSEPEPAGPVTAAAPARPARAPDPIYVGLDLGTSACVAVAVNAGGKELGRASAPLPMPVRNGAQVTQDPLLWWKAASAALQQLFTQVPAARVRAIAVDGTSGTLLLTDAAGTPVTPAMMYNDSRARAEADSLAALADPQSGAHGASSSLAKLLWLHGKQLNKKAAHALHQADWIAGMLSAQWGHSDYNNCLKLGYDVIGLGWPAWLAELGLDARLLPTVHAPGTAIGTVSPEIAGALGLPADTQVLAGTTDGVAAFLAAGTNRLGQAVTSLGTTLVLKLLSDQPVFSAEHGVYSHRLGDRWLAGGASNSGGAALLQYFKIEQLRELTPMLDPEHLTGLDYYPLPDVGERFPVNDPNMVAIMEPLPGDSLTLFQAMLEGIARIEGQGYELLRQLGAPAVTHIATTGGGSGNQAWQRIRETLIGVPVQRAEHQAAAYGTALLASGRLAARTAA